MAQIPLLLMGTKLELVAHTSGTRGDLQESHTHQYADSHLEPAADLKLPRKQNGQRRETPIAKHRDSFK